MNLLKIFILGKITVTFYANILFEDIIKLFFSKRVTCRHITWLLRQNTNMI